MRKRSYGKSLLLAAALSVMLIVSGLSALALPGAGMNQTLESHGGVIHSLPGFRARKVGTDASNQPIQFGLPLLDLGQVGLLVLVCFLCHAAPPWLCPEEQHKSESTTVVLEPVNEANFEDVVALDVSDDQRRFVASNALSVAHAYVFAGWEPYAVRIGPTIVGFTLIYIDPNEATGHIVRFMIDRNHQRRGFGRLALESVIEFIRSRPGIEAIELCVYPENVPARRLYESAGFHNTGEMNEHEMVYRLRVAPDA